MRHDGRRSERRTLSRPFSSGSDETAAGLWLVVDNAESYELDEKAVKLTLSPGQHRIDLVEDRETPPIDSYCISNMISIEATVKVFSHTLYIATNRGDIVMGRGRMKTNNLSMYPCTD